MRSSVEDVANGQAKPLQIQIVVVVVVVADVLVGWLACSAGVMIDKQFVEGSKDALRRCARRYQKERTNSAGYLGIYAPRCASPRRLQVYGC